MHPGTVLLELGGMLFGLGLLARLAGRVGLSPIPLYLLGGLAFGKGGVLPLVTAEPFISTAAEVGVVLLLLVLGLEYSAVELVGSLTRQAPIGLLDMGLNAVPGVVAARLGAGRRARPGRHHRGEFVGHRRQAARRPRPARQPGDADGPVHPRA